MIISVSRRTDIPSFYMDWFLNRLKKGWVLVRNPFLPSQVSRVALSPETVECIGFWTKNPAPMLDKLNRLEPYPFFVQFTINPYDEEMETSLPDRQIRLETFRELSARLGSERVIWRYSPIILSDQYTQDFHVENFGRTAEALAGYTRQGKISFLEIYKKIKERMVAFGAEDDDGAKLGLARQLAETAKEYGLSLSGCGKPNLAEAGIRLEGCIDAGLIEKITGKKMRLRRDSGQRGACRCAESVDVGAYQTCLNGCIYCYANSSPEKAVRKSLAYDPASPFLCDKGHPGDKIKDRRIQMHHSNRSDLPLFADLD